MPTGIYLDNSMTTRPSEKSISKMLPFYTDKWGSTSSPHQMGQELFPAMEKSLQSIYALIGAKETSDFVFTSSGAEAVNQVILTCFLEVTRSTGKNQFITSTIDEAPTLMSIHRLEQLDCVGKYAKVNSHGVVTAESIADVITPRTALVSLSWANCLTGVINPMAEIAALCQSRGILLHLDATHVLGKLFYDLEDIKPDYLTFNGDHFHAPKGTGGLFIKQNVKCKPLIIGGLEQAGRRAGDLNVPGLVALGVAAHEALETRDLLCTEVARLRDQLEEGILREYPEAVIFFRDQERLPSVTAIGFPGIANEALLYAINRKNVFANIGGGSSQQIALVLTAAGVEEALAQTAINFSLSRETTEEEIERAIELIVTAAKQLRKCSVKFVSVT
jgi:cysteine desulfurase